MKTRRIHFALVPLLGLAACAASPAHYLALSSLPAPQGQTQTLPSTTQPLPLLVAQVSMPAELDRLYLTRQRGPNSIEVSATERWVAPLGGMIQRVLARDLVASMPSRTVLMPGDPPPVGGYLTLHLVVTHFMPTLAGPVMLDADWFVVDSSDGKTVAAGRVAFDHPASSDPQGQAAAMSSMLTRLARLIAARIGV